MSPVPNSQLPSCAMTGGLGAPRSRLPKRCWEFPEGPYLQRASTEALEHFRDLCRRLEAAGWRIEPRSTFGDIDEIEARHSVVLAAEAAAYHRRWYPRHRDLYDSRTVDLLERGLRVHSAELAEARQECRYLRHRLHQAMDSRSIDLWITPAAPGPAPAGLSSTGSPIMNLPFSQAGLPFGVPTLRPRCRRSAPGPSARSPLRSR